jgi:hypothetical protein
LDAIGEEHGLQRAARTAEDPDVDPRLAGAYLGWQRGVARPRALEQRGLGRTHDPPSVGDGDARRDGDRLAHAIVRARQRTDFGDREADRGAAARIGRLEADTVAHHERRAHLNDDLASLVAQHRAEHAAAVVRVVAGDVLATHTPAIHPTGEAAAVDLRQRLDVGGRRRGPVAGREAIEEGAVAVGDGGDVFGPLLATLDLQAADAGLGDVREMVRGGEVLGGDEKAAIQLDVVGHVVEHVVLAARLGAGAAVGAPLRDHPGHVALPAVRDAERAVDEGLEPQVRHGGADGANVVEGVLAREHDTLDTEGLHDARAALVVHGHLRRAVDLETRIDPLDQTYEPDVLHDCGVDAAVDRFAEKHQRVSELGGLEEDVEGEVDPAAALVRQPTGLTDLIQRELRPFVARVEPLGAQIHGVGTVGERGTNGVEGAGGSEELGHGKARHKR